MYISISVCVDNHKLYIPWSTYIVNRGNTNMVKEEVINKIVEVADILAEVEDILENEPDAEEYILITLLEKYGISHACGGVVDDSQSQLVFVFKGQVYEWSEEEGCGIIEDEDRIEHIKVRAAKKGYDGFEEL